MPIIAKDSQREYTNAPEGLYQGVCVDVVDLGLQDGQYGPKHKVQIRWQLEITDETANPPRPFLVMKHYTLSLNEKATLRAHLEAWRGRKFTPAELEGFDLENLISVNGQIQIVHVLTTKGGTFANVQAIVPLGKGMTKMRPSPDYVRVCNRDKKGSGNIAVLAEEEVPF